MILELPKMKELPKRTLHEKGRQYPLAGRWVGVAGGAVVPPRCPRNVRCWVGHRCGATLAGALIAWECALAINAKETPFVMCYST